MDFSREYYLAGVARQAATMPPEQGAALLSWFEGYLALAPGMACPSAASLDFDEAGIGLLAVLQPDHPAALAEALAGQMARLEQIGLGVAFVPVESDEFDGVTVQRWHLEFDEAAVAALGQARTTSPGAAQAAQMVTMLRSLLPELSLATVGGHVLLGATADHEPFAALVARAGQRVGKPDARVAEAADAAGPDTRQVLVGDLTPLANWMIAATRSMAGFEGMPPLDVPIPFAAVTTAGPAGYGFSIGTDASAIRAAVAATEAMVRWRNGGPQP